MYSKGTEEKNNMTTQNKQLAELVEAWQQRNKNKTDNMQKIGVSMIPLSSFRLSARGKK